MFSRTRKSLTSRKTKDLRFHQTGVESSSGTSHENKVLPVWMLVQCFGPDAVRQVARDFSRGVGHRSQHYSLQLRKAQSRVPQSMGMLIARKSHNAFWLQSGRIYTSIDYVPLDGERHKLTAAQAFAMFGIDLLYEAREYGSVSVPLKQALAGKQIVGLLVRAESGVGTVGGIVRGISPQALMPDPML